MVALEKAIEEMPWYKLEHEWDFTKFFFRVLAWGLLGSVLGGITERVLSQIQGPNIQQQPRLKCAGFATLNVVIIAIIFYIMLRLKSKHFTDWMLNTISGFVFALTYFDSLFVLGNNINCVFRQ